MEWGPKTPVYEVSMIKPIPQVARSPIYPVLWETRDRYTLAIVNRPDGTRYDIKFLTNAIPEEISIPKALSDRFGVVITYDNAQPRRLLRGKDGDPLSSGNDNNTVLHIIETFFTKVLLNPGLYAYVLVPPDDVHVDQLTRIIKILSRRFGTTPEETTAAGYETPGALFQLEAISDED